MDEEEGARKGGIRYSDGIVIYVGSHNINSAASLLRGGTYTPMSFSMLSNGSDVHSRAYLL
eukprot:13933819-Heterocapsa_arctica.AAC.1